MVVDDQPSIANLVADTLSAQGYEVLKPYSREEAILMIESLDHEIHLLLTDVVMLKMNGKELSEKVTEKYTNIKTLFMSGYPADQISNRGVLSKGVNYLQKLIRPNILLRKVRQVFDEKSPSKP